jgi:hypothetical protein
MESLKTFWEKYETSKNAQFAEQTSHDVRKWHMNIKITRLYKNRNFSDDVPEGSSRSYIER